MRSVAPTPLPRVLACLAANGLRMFAVRPPHDLFTWVRVRSRFMQTRALHDICKLQCVPGSVRCGFEALSRRAVLRRLLPTVWTCDQMSLVVCADVLRLNQWDRELGRQFLGGWQRFLPQNAANFMAACESRLMGSFCFHPPCDPLPSTMPMPSSLPSF